MTRKPDRTPDQSTSTAHSHGASRRLRNRRRKLTVTSVVVLACLGALGYVAIHAQILSPSDAGSVAIDPAQFSNGACELFGPTSGNRHTTVFLDAGHGGIDPGAIGTTETGRSIDEASETLPVELDAMDLLRAQGYSVVVSRTRASSVVKLTPNDVANNVLTLKGAHDDVAARDVCANDVKASVLVGIYFNSGATTADAGSVTGYDPDRPFANANLKLANLVQKNVLHAMNSHGWAIPNDGALSDVGLGSIVPTAPGTGGIAAEAARYNHLLLLGPAMAGYFSTPSLMPGAVVEPLFISDPFEGTIASSADGQHAIASGIAQAIEQYFEQSSH